MPHPVGAATSGNWDVPSSLKCPIRPHPSFGTAPLTHGSWREARTGFYEFECVIRAGGTGATSGAGLWMLRLPRQSDYQLRITVPDFDNGDEVNSWMVADAQIGASNGAHLGPHSVHTRSTLTGLESSENTDFLVFTKKGGLFIGGGAWTPGNLHVRSLGALPCTWVAI